MSPTPDLSPARVLIRAAAQHPRRPSLIWAESGLTWDLSTSAKRVRQAAAALAARGVGVGERVVVCGPNSPWHFVVHVAGSWNHSVTVPLSPRLPAGQLLELLEDCAPALVITTDEVRALLSSAQRPPVEPLVEHAAAPAAQTSRAWGGMSLPCPVLTFDEFAEEVAAAAPVEGLPPACSEELAAIVYTSGSSGTPRGVELTHANLWWGSASFRDGFEYCPGTDVVGVCAPLSHIGGFNGTTLDAFSHGGTLVVFPGFDPDLVLRSIERYHISQMFLVPIMCHLLVEAQARVGADLSSYRNPLIGGDAMSADLEAKLRGIGLAPIHVWGMTETAGAGTMLAADVFAEHPGAIGRPFPYLDLRLVDADGREITAPDVIGEIEVSGPGVSDAYYRRPGDTEASRDGDWLRTGDLGTLDAQGFVHIVGRASRMIHTAAEMVPPRRVEEALRRLDSVADALVVGVDDERWGQIVGALLVPAAGITADMSGSGAGMSGGAALPDDPVMPDARALREALAGELAPWEQVRCVRWVDALPVTSTGKPDPTRARELLEDARKE